GPWRFVFPWPPSHGGRKAETGAPDLGRVCLHSPFTPLVLLELSPTGTGLNGWRHSVGGHISTPRANNYFKTPSSNTHVKLRLDTAHSFHFSFRSVVEDFETKLVGGMSQTAGKTKQQAGTCKDYTLIMWKADTATGATAASQ
ncbi:hypothetical protein KUCAC02_010823, partial [Chaenocephalus aceratus]